MPASSARLWPPSWLPGAAGSVSAADPESGADLVEAELDSCRVSVLEAASGPAQGASGKSWAWLNANRKEPAE